MSWNYRIVKRTYENEVTYTVHTAWYGKGEDDPHSIGADPMYPIGENLDELLIDLDRMKEALNKPVLNYEDF